MKHNYLKHLFTALLLLVATVASAHDFEVDGVYYNITNSATKEVAVTYKGYSENAYSGEYSGSVVIPEIVVCNDETYSVTSIGRSAFHGCSGLTSVEIPNSVTSIGEDAFLYCNRLTSATIGDGVTSIGNGAFSYCYGLTSVEIPNSVTSIGSSAFSGCNGLTGELVIPNSVTSIGSSAFSGCYGLTGELVIPNSVTSIGSSAFSGCNGLTSIVVAEGNTVYDCRENCNAIIEKATKTLIAGCKNSVIPNSVTSIGNNAFQDCSALTSIEIPNSVTNIGNGAFSGCSGLTSVEIPNSVTSIGSSAFSGCSGLASIEIPNSVTNIGSGAFSYCSGLTSVEIPNSVTAIEGWTFSGCSGLRNIEIPNSVESIGEDAFYNCSGLTSVTIGNSVTSIKDYAFYYNVDAVFEFTAEIPATIGGAVFEDNAVFVVPSATVEAYKTAWSGFSARIVGRDDAFVAVEVEAKETTSGIMERVGIDKVGSIAKLTVKGSINSYDVIQFRDKMPLLRELDLSEAVVVASDKAFYDGNCTKDNDLGDNALKGLSKLNLVKLPKDLVAIGDNAFSGCSSLREIVIPACVKSCNTRVFYECSNLEKVTLPDGLEVIEDAAFSSCHSLKEIKLPPSIKEIGSSAFSYCYSFEEIRIPSSVQCIGEYAFGRCDNLNKVYTYTVEPTVIKENTFSTFATATLYVPSFSFSNYYWDDGWKRFLDLEEFNEPYEYFYVNNDCVLDENTGYISGVDGNAPDADINAGGGFIVEGEQGDGEVPNQSLGNVNVGCDGNGTSASIIGDNNLHIDDLHIKINVNGGRWYFFAFPFDIRLSDISMENGSDYVFRYYDGEERAKNGNGGWKDVDESILEAACGYIFQCSADDVLVLSIEDVKFKKEDKYNELVAHVSDNLKDASWNFVGNPYLSYYDLADMDYSAPVTVWDGEKYVAIRPGDDDYHFAPYEAFFVQKPEGQESIAYDGEEQMTKNQSEKKAEKQSAARRARGINPDRLLINLVLDNGTSSDRTRIVFNNQQSLAYETACDASKFETKGVAQLYTIGRDNVHYAINERPADNGVVMLGYTAPTAGFYTIEAQRMDAEVFVKDYKTGTLHNLNDGAYSFSTDAGTFNERFEILLKGTAPGTTGIDEVEGEPTVDASQNGEVKGDVYDLKGRKVNRTENGIYIINGEKILK